MARGLNTQDPFDAAQFGTIAGWLADRFGTRGLPITLSTACASGATAIQLGVEAIRRGECDRALSIGADGSATAEALIRFSLLSALSTHNDIRRKGVEAVLQGPRRFCAGRRLGGAGAGIAGGCTRPRRRPCSASCAGCGEKADDFHRTRSKPDGSPAIAAVRAALADAGIERRRHRLCQRARHLDAGKRQDGASVAVDRVRRADAATSRSRRTSR